MNDEVEALGIRVSMDGKGRWMDNVFIVRLWRSLKCGDIHLKNHRNPMDTFPPTAELNRKPIASPDPSNHDLNPPGPGSVKGTTSVPNNDSEDIPKDINVTSMCGVTIRTYVAKDGRRGKRIAVALRINLCEYKKPDYLPHSDPEIIAAIARALIGTLDTYRCEVKDITTKTTAEGEKLAKLLEQHLLTPKGEQDDAHQTTTAVDSQSKSNQKPAAGARSQ